MQKKQKKCDIRLDIMPFIFYFNGCKDERSCSSKHIKTKGNKSMENIKRIPKFIAIVHNDIVSYHKSLVYIALDNTTEKLAIAEGVRKGFNVGNPCSVSIAKRIRVEDNGLLVHTQILRVYRNGKVSAIRGKEAGEWYTELTDFE